MTAELWTGNGLFVGEIGAVASPTGQLNFRICFSNCFYLDLLTRSGSAGTHKVNTPAEFCKAARQRAYVISARVTRS